jgi:hypothetical protein
LQLWATSTTRLPKRWWRQTCSCAQQHTDDDAGSRLGGGDAAVMVLTVLWVAAITPHANKLSPSYIRSTQYMQDRSSQSSAHDL